MLRFLAVLLCLGATTLGVQQAAAANTSFAIDLQNNRFLLDGQPFRYISGSIHYFRIPPDRWREKLERIRALGMNAIQFYIPWNFHEANPGEFNFYGDHDFVQFIRTAESVGLYTLLRVGPYVCAEWENGGLPWWILLDNGVVQRSSDAKFKAHVQRWYGTLLPMVKPLLRANGGPVLMVQVENEYGSYYACDQNYTIWLRDLFKAQLGNDTVLYTTDGGAESYLKCGAVPGVFSTVDFGVTSSQGVDGAFAAQRKYQPNGPLVNSEFYPGWLVLWGQTENDIPSPDQIVQTASYMYSKGASMNFYMTHGGTNFGFWNGAETNAPCVTSYDYSAPLTEAGDVTPSYIAIRNWIGSLTDWPYQPQALPAPINKRGFGDIPVSRLRPITDLLDPSCPVYTDPQNFEQISHPYGFVGYRTKLTTCGTNLTIPAFRDFVHVFLDGNLQGVLVAKFNSLTRKTINISGCKAGSTLVLLVENQSRQTYETINDYKGILGQVLIDGRQVQNWEHCGLDFTALIARVEQEETQQRSAKLLQRQRLSHRHLALNRVPHNSPNSLLADRLPEPLPLVDASASPPGLYVGILIVSDPTADTFLDTTGWGKGVIFVNGRNLGRYWASAGPQLTLYVPSSWLREGSNRIVLFELEGPSTTACVSGNCKIRSVATPIYTWDSQTVLNTQNSTFLSRRQADLNGRRIVHRLDRVAEPVV